MKLFCFIIWLSYSELSLHLVSCMFGLRAEREYALAVQIRNDKLDFAWPIIDNFGQFNQYTAIYAKFYYLCPENRKSELLKVEKIVYESYGPKEKICKYAVKPIILKVNTHLENYQRENAPIDEYKIGFSMNYKDFKGTHSLINSELHDKKHEYLTEDIYSLNIIKTFDPTTLVEYCIYNERNREYNVGDRAFLIPSANARKSNFQPIPSENNQTYFLPMITVFTYETWKHIFAVSYEIIAEDVQKKLENNTLDYTSSDLFPNKIEEFYQNQESKLREILDDQYDPQKHALQLGSLVNENNFIVDAWKKTARYKIHQILIWESNIEMWRNIQEFARHVGGQSTTTITAGIGKTLIIRGQSDKKFEMKWGEGEDLIFIPELYWLAIIYYKNNITTGMVIIMHNEPMGGKDVEKICITNQCVENNTWMLRKEYIELVPVYCCELNSNVFKKLGIGFIHEDYNFFQDEYELLYSFPPRWKEDKEEIYGNGEKLSGQPSS